MAQNILRKMVLQEIIERVILCKGKEQYIPSRTDPMVGLFLSVLLVSAYRHLGSKNDAKRSTYDGATKGCLICCSFLHLGI